MATLPGPGNISFVEHVPGSPEDVFETDSSVSRRMLDVAWTDKVQAAKNILGYSEVQVAGTFKFIHRQTPMPLNSPLRQNQRPFLFATKIERAEGLGFRSKDFNDIAAYEKVRYSTIFETLPYDIYDDGDIIGVNGVPDESLLIRYVTKKVKPSVEAFNIPGGTLFWQSGSANVVGKPVQIGLNKLLVHNGIELTWHQVPLLAVPSRCYNPTGTNLAIDTCLGKVNATPFAGYAAGTLLMIGVEIKPFTSIFGERIYDIVYNFKYFEPATSEPTGNFGHEFIFNWQDSTWIEVNRNLPVASNLLTQTAGVSLYDWAEFANLFRPA